MKRTLIYSAIIPALFSTLVSVAIAADNGQDQSRQQNQNQVYGSELMTQQERDDYRAQMNAARTDQERTQIRQAHHDQIKERARQQSVSLPDEAPAYGKTPGMMPGGGMQPGSGNMN